MRIQGSITLGIVFLFLAAGLGHTTQRGSEPAVLISTDAQAARPQAGPYNGGGTTTAYGYFDNGEAKALAFRKRALHPGSAIGLHPIGFDEEVYYIVSGIGRLTANGKTRVVTAGTAILMQRGAMVSLQQEGSEDLVIFIAYPREPQK